MKRRIFWGTAGLALLLSLLIVIFISAATGRQMRSQLAQNLLVSAEKLAAAMDKGDAEAVVRSAYLDARTTWVSPEGVVLYDSTGDTQAMDNHIDRAEITDALQKGKGTAVRHSDTLRLDMVYAAVRLDDGSILRLAAPERNAQKLADNLRLQLLLGLILVALAAFFLSGHFTRLLVRPINKIDMQNPVDTCPYEELLPLARRISGQQSELNAQVALLKAHQQETETIINAMSEGFVILDMQLNILSINRSACRLFGTTAQEALGKPLPAINRQKEIMQLVLDLDKRREGDAQFTLGSRTYLMTANVVDDRERGIVLLVSDITDKVEGENMRKRFSANVSHELRTPLTTICGYAEMLDSGMVKPEDQADFIHRINRESKRMLTLVEDILKLSRMDEGFAGGHREPVSLLHLAKTTAEALESAARAKEVTIEVTGEDTKVTGDTTLLSELVFNLMDNAVKYNKNGGSVSVRVHRDEGETVLTVSDTGIGIEERHQDKIFERFYRTDKSRSKDTGGTGLGLSIVKHAAEYHQARLQVQSKPGEGTAMSVFFPDDAFRVTTQKG